MILSFSSIVCKNLLSVKKNTRRVPFRTQNARYHLISRRNSPCPLFSDNGGTRCELLENLSPAPLRSDFPLPFPADSHQPPRLFRIVKRYSSSSLRFLRVQYSTVSRNCQQFFQKKVPGAPFFGKIGYGKSNSVPRAVQLFELFFRNLLTKPCPFDIISKSDSPTCWYGSVGRARHW